MHTPRRDKITFKTLDESDAMLDMSCFYVYYLFAVLYIKDLDWALRVHVQLVENTLLLRANKCTIKSEFQTKRIWPKFVK